MFTNFIHIQYCYSYLIGQIPVGLLLYSHIPTAIAALLFGGFLIFNSRKLPNTTLFVVSVFFALWCLVDLSSWFSFLGADVTMFTWSLADFFSIVFFFFSYYFLYTFITKEDLPRWQKIAGILLVLPTAAWTFLGSNLFSFDANTCEAIENDLTTTYLFLAEAIFLLASIVLTLVKYKYSSDKGRKKEILLSGTGVSLFLGFFLSATYLASILVNYETWSQSAYNYEIYGLFGMPVLLMYLGYLIVRYKAFDLKIFGAQALILVLIVLVGSQFAFVSSLISQVLVAVTLVFMIIVGILLIRSVKKEVEQLERIEKLAVDLEKTNQRQEVLFHFIGHEVKGFLTKDAGAFAAISEGDFGTPPDTMKSFVDAALAESRLGADSVINILKASNLKRGTVTYTKEPFDLKELAYSVVEKEKSKATKKGLDLSFSADEGSYMVTGDKTQIGEHVLRNLIENAINYTPSGSVMVLLKKEADTYLLSIQDTGIGIAPEDKEVLFTEGGHGKESIKINAHSTGYGLYIAKQITMAHGGTVRAESEGPGKGSTFTVQLPAA